MAEAGVACFVARLELFATAGTGVSETRLSQKGLSAGYGLRAQDAPNSAFTRCDNHPTAVAGEGGADRLSTTTMRSMSPLR